MPREKYDTENNGIPFKTIIRRDETGKIIDIEDKPKLGRIDPDLHVSGCHMFPDREQDHYDHYQNGSKIGIERPTKEKKLKFPYKVDEDKVLI
nr:hypothetical protein [Nanoarchaeum sp.]